MKSYTAYSPSVLPLRKKTAARSIIEELFTIYNGAPTKPGATTALEDTEYLFICNGAVLFFNENSFTSYLSWEELRRMQAAHDSAKRSAA